MPSPRNNKSKAGNNTRPPEKSKRKLTQKEIGPGTGNEPLDTALPLHAAPRADVHESDDELVLTFLSHYQALELAMIRAGYTRSSHTPGTAQADWARFARSIQPRFDPKSSPVLEGAVAYMLLDDDYLELRNERIENAYPWENPDPHNDTVWLSELVQLTGRKLIQGLNFPRETGCDITMVTAALFIVEEWSQLDPEVERFLRNVQ
jgi:hypothetical protein